MNHHDHHDHHHIILNERTTHPFTHRIFPMMNNVFVFSEKLINTTSTSHSKVVFFSWLGGISIVEEVTTQPTLDENASVDELWNRLFQYELKG